MTIDQQAEDMNTTSLAKDEEEVQYLMQTVQIMLGRCG